MNCKLLIILICAVSFTIVGSNILEASAQASDQTYTLRVKSEPNILYIGGGGDFQEGTQVTLDTAPESFGDYTFLGWKIDGRWANGNPLTIRMDFSHTAVAVYSKDLAGNILVDTIPRITEITVDGTIYLPDELPLSFSWMDGSTHIISTPNIIKDDPTTRYVFDSWKDNNMQSDRTITVNSDTKEFVVLYETQHLLKAITEHGTVLGAGWQEAGKTATFELQSDIVLDKKNDNIRHVFDSWDLGDYVNSPSNSVDITEPVTVMAKWTPQFKLDLKTSVPDYDTFGSGWYEQEKSVALIAEEEMESSISDTRYVFDKWVSKGPNPVIIPNAQEPSTTIIIDQPYVIEAVYRESYRVNVWSQYGSPIGGGFYPAGDIATITLSQSEIVVQPNKVKKVFAGWNTFGARTMNPGIATDVDDFSAQNLLVFVDNPLNVTTNWKTQYYLDVLSQEGNAKGAGWYDIGRMVPISVDQRGTPPGMWSAKVFDTWSGDISSQDMNERVIMTEPKTVIAEWRVDNTPGIINGAILAGVVGMAAIIYTKTQKNKTKSEKILSMENMPFEKFLSLRKKTPDNTPSFYNKPKRNIINWLLGKE